MQELEYFQAFMCLMAFQQNTENRVETALVTIYTAFVEELERCQAFICLVAFLRNTENRVESALVTT